MSEIDTNWRWSTADFYFYFFQSFQQYLNLLKFTWFLFHTCTELLILSIVNINGNLDTKQKIHPTGLCIQIFNQYLMDFISIYFLWYFFIINSVLKIS